jgi:glycerol uptake facilitator protein
MNLGTIFLSETVGTAMLVLLGTGVVATAILTKSKGLGGGWLLISRSSPVSRCPTPPADT